MLHFFEHLKQRLGGLSDNAKEILKTILLSVAAASGGVGEIPELMPAIQCPQHASIRDASQLFINAPQGFITIIDEKKLLVGILTLHDLLRTQVAATE